MELAKVVSEQECRTGHGVIILSLEYPGLEDQHLLLRPLFSSHEQAPPSISFLCAVPPISSLFIL